MLPKAVCCCFSVSVDSPWERAVAGNKVPYYIKWVLAHSPPPPLSLSSSRPSCLSGFHLFSFLLAGPRQAKQAWNFLSEHILLSLSDFFKDFFKTIFECPKVGCVNAQIKQLAFSKCVYLKRLAFLEQTVEKIRLTMKVEAVVWKCIVDFSLVQLGLNLIQYKSTKHLKKE